MKWSSLFGACAVVFVVASFDAHAESMRCNDDMAQIGDSTGAILAKCGEPMSKHSFCKPVEQESTGKSANRKGTTVNVTPCETVDEWTYNPGSGQFFTTLRFESGVLKSMKYGARVP